MSDIVKGGLVDADGRLMQGDQILSVNGEDVRSATQEAVAALLKVPRPVAERHTWCDVCRTIKRKITSAVSCVVAVLRWTYKNGSGEV